jgi:NADPH-dependent curcumin reductase CurA
MNPTNRQIVLAARPEGMVKDSDFRLVEGPIPRPADGQVLVRVIWLSVDPYMRGRIGEGPSYAAPVPIGGVIVGGTVGEVIESRDPDLKQGDIVECYLGWQAYGVAPGRACRRLDPRAAPITTALGILGLTGLTAYHGLIEVGRPRAGETVFVSGAAGAVGSVAGQIARIAGCRVVGSAGGAAKVRHLTADLGFDAALDYKAENDLLAGLRRVCPEGIDVYFDNVGGPMTDAVLQHINLHARVVICGQIAYYNERGKAVGPRNLFHLIIKRARIEGMLVRDFADKDEAARTRLARWLREGRIAYREDVVEGLENAPAAFRRLFTGENLGKQLVRVGPDPA